VPFADGPAGGFLLLCLRGRFDPEALREAGRLSKRGAVEWEALERQVWREALGPLLFCTVQGQGLLPLAFEAALRQAYLESAVRNTLLLHELSQVGDQLAGVGISLLALKGASLAEDVYNNVALRPMRDLDILVRHEDAQRAVQVLRAKGYRVADSEVHAGMSLAYENELRLLKDGITETTLDVHWHLLDSPFYQFGMGMEWFWETARPRTCAGAAGLMLGPEALLLYLCAHLALHHRRSGMLWRHDVAEVLHRYGDELDWDCVLQRAAEYELVLPLQQVVMEVAEQWQVPLPDGVREKLVELRPSAHERKVYAGLTADNRPVARRFRADLAGIPDWGGRLRYAWRHMFPSASYMRQRYKVRRDALLPFYYLYRWLLGLTEAIDAVVRGWNTGASR